VLIKSLTPPTLSETGLSSTEFIRLEWGSALHTWPPSVLATEKLCRKSSKRNHFRLTHGGRITLQGQCIGPLEASTYQSYFYALVALALSPRFRTSARSVSDLNGGSLRSGEATMPPNSQPSLPMTDFPQRQRALRDLFRLVGNSEISHKRDCCPRSRLLARLAFRGFNFQIARHSAITDKASSIWHWQTTTAV